MEAILRITIPELYKIETEVAVFHLSVDLAEDHLIDGVIRTFPDDFKNMDVLIVAYSSSNGFTEWGAYSGLPVNSRSYSEHQMFGQDMNDLETIKQFGEKLNGRVAEKLFPQFVEAGYTYRT